MEPESLGNKAVKGAVWAAIDRFGSMALQFFVNLVLARLLTPSDFGTIGMLYIFIAVSITLSEGGFASALIQKKESTQVDYSTIFFWNLGTSVALYGIIYVLAPFIADFYDLYELSRILRIFGLSIVFSSIVSVQIAKLQKNLSFKHLAIVNILSYIIGSGIAIIMAFNGYGVWSLVALNLVYIAFKILLFYFLTKWLPDLVFSYSSLKKLFNFGGYLLCANLLQTACQNVQGLIIGKRFSAAQLGYYSQAEKLNSVVSESIPRIIVQVMYPVYSKIQDDRQRLVSTVLMNIRIISFFIFPLIACLILVSQPLIEFLYGEKWLISVPYFRILCVGGIFTSLTNINYYAVAAVGESRSLFLWSFYKWGVLLLLLIGSSFISMTAMVWGVVLSNFNIFMVNVLLSRKFVGISLRGVCRSIMPIAMLSIGILSFLFLIDSLFNHLPWPLLIIVYLISFLGFSYLFHFKSLNESLNLLRKIRAN